MAKIVQMRVTVRKASGEEAHGSAAKTMPARMDAASQMCARERW